MIGKTQWFTRRKYSGWGLTPKTWQGFVYVGVIVLFGLLIQSALVPAELKFPLSAVLIALFVADVLHILSTIQLDERELKIEALAERNASWTMVGATAALLIYFSLTNITLAGEQFIPYLLFPMVAGLVVKASSTFFLQQKAL